MCFWELMITTLGCGCVSKDEGLDVDGKHLGSACYRASEPAQLPSQKEATIEPSPGALPMPLITMVSPTMGARWRSRTTLTSRDAVV